MAPPIQSQILWFSFLTWAVMKFCTSYRMAVKAMKSLFTWMKVLNVAIPKITYSFLFRLSLPHLLSVKDHLVKLM